MGKFQLFVALYRRNPYNETMSKAHEKAVARYNAKTYTEIKLRMQKADAENLKKYLDGRSANGFINEAIAEKMKREKTQGEE